MAEITQYASFLLRLWRTYNREPPGCAGWQSEIQHIQSGQCWTFDTTDGLLGFLNEQTGHASVTQSDGLVEATINDVEGGMNMSSENKALMQRSFADLWSTGDLSIVNELYAADYVSHDPNDPSPGGIQGLQQSINLLQNAFPNIHFAVEDQIAEDDKVVTRWSVTGTHQGEFLNIPATDKSIAVMGITISRVADGRVQESWTNWDMLGLLQQLGTVPSPQATAD